MTAQAELTLLRRDLSRPSLAHLHAGFRARIAEIQAELRQEHAAFVRVLSIEHREQARKRRETWRLLTPMSCDDWLDGRGRMHTQNCEDGRQ